MFERINRPERIRSEGEEVKYQHRKDERDRQEQRGRGRTNKRAYVG